MDERSIAQGGHVTNQETADGNGMLSAAEMVLVERLREEASEVKECFTKFSFQVISLSTAAFWLLVRFPLDYPALGVANLFVMLLVFSVARIGNYKFATANRQSTRSSEALGSTPAVRERAIGRAGISAQMDNI